MGLLGAMVVGGATSAIVGRYAARRQFEELQAAQAQQAQINQAQQQAAQALQAAQAVQGGQTPQSSIAAKKDPIQELQKLAGLKQQGLISDDEYQKLKMQLLSGS
jgi:type II secretory pathway pseudopilin PulG